MALRQQGRGGGLKGHDLYRRVLRLQIPARAGDSAAGAGAGHEDVHLSLRVRPDLRAGGGLVSRRVGGILELAGDDAAGNAPAELLRLGHGPGHALGAGRQDDLRPVGGDEGPALHAHGVRHGEDHPVAPGGSHGSQTDAGVAGGGLDDGAAGGQAARRLRLGDHAGGHPVLGAAGGVHALQLGQHRGLEAVGSLVIAQLQQGRAADQFRDAVIDGHSDPSVLQDSSIIHPPAALCNRKAGQPKHTQGSSKIT